MHYLAAKFKDAKDEFTLHRIRDLSDSEVIEYAQRKTDHIKLRNRMSLLHIVDRNFRDLDSYRKIADDTSKRKLPEMLEINRLFMNYLSSAYSLREHLKTHLQRDFGKKSDSAEKYIQFLEAMEQHHKPYAFIQDFRNYVQHCGFPIRRAILKEDQAGRLLHLLYPRLALLSEYTGWGKSKLKDWTESEVDLSDIVTKHHHIIKKEFFVVITANYGARAENNDGYFRLLHDEAKAIDPSAFATVIVEESFTEKGGTVTFEDVPANPLGELGISINKK